MFDLTAYSSNSTYDDVNKAQVTEDLYSMDDVKRNYETYMDYYCDNLYDSRKPPFFCRTIHSLMQLQARPACSVLLLAMLQAEIQLQLQLDICMVCRQHEGCCSVHISA